MNPELMQEGMPPEGMIMTPQSMPAEGMPQSEDIMMQPMGEEQSPMILVHISKKEADYLDYMQGGMSENPGTQLREYSKLSSILNSEEFGGFLDDLAEEFELKGKPDKNVEKLYDEMPKEGNPKGFQHTEGDFDPEVMKLEAAGESLFPQDEELVHMPLDFAQYLDKIQGGAVFNPITGFRQYGILNGITKFISRSLGIKQTHVNEFVRIGATVVGGALGAPFGMAHIGAGLGNALGNWSTGADVGKSLRRGVGTGAAVYGAGQLGGALGSSTMGGATQGGLGGLFSGASAGAGAGSGAGTASASGGSTSGMGSSLFDKIYNASAPAASGGSGGILSGMSNALMSNALPTAAIAGLLMKGHGDNKSAQEKAQREHQEELRRIRKQYGWDEKMSPMSSFSNRSLNPIPQSAKEMLEGRGYQHFIDDPMGRYAKGGSVHGTKLLPGEEMVQQSKFVRGPGKGQDDKIPINLPEGSWIVDSSSVSMLGDGSSERGAEVLDHLTSKLRGLHKSHGGKVEIPGRRVPALLSDGEYVINTPEVSLLGHGKNRQGTKYLKEFTETLRSHKATKGSGLPPRAKDAVDYFPAAARKVLNVRST